MVKFKIQPSKWFANKRFVLIFSIVAAIVFWLVITVSVTPHRIYKIHNVKVNIPYAPTGLQPIGNYENTTVTVTVEGRLSQVVKLTSDDIVVTAATTAVNGITQAGTYELQLHASKSNMLRDFTIRSVSPASIEVHFDEVVEKTFNVTAQETGATVEGDLVLEGPSIPEINQTIQIQGPKQKLDQIAKVVAVAQVDSQLTKTMEYNAKIELYDEHDNPISKEFLTLGFDEVQLTLTVSKMKTVSIRPTFINTPAAYEGAPLPHSLSVKELEVTGPPDVIDALEFIPLAPIDFAEITTSNTTFEREIDFPGSVRNTNNLQSVTVKLDLSNIESTTLMVTQFEILNKPEGTIVNNPSPINSVLIFGPKGSIEEIVSSKMTAQIDLSNKTSGQNEVDVTMIINDYNDCWAAGKYKTIVNIQ